MFSGLVETIGKIKQIHSTGGCLHFTIAPQKKLEDIAIGDSIAVNGVCLTVTDFSSDTFNVTAVPETLRLTNLNQLKEKNLVNLERSLKADARIGGHYVQGHVDCTGQIDRLEHDGDHALLLNISIPTAFSNYLINKGYVALDGMSITVIHAGKNEFTVTLIPHTQAMTIAHQYQIGSTLNIEIDQQAKYIEKFLGARHARTN